MVIAPPDETSTNTNAKAATIMGFLVTIILIECILAVLARERNSFGIVVLKGDAYMNE